jgi:ribosomal protein S18 acetylase RimI-like enzyme
MFLNDQDLLIREARQEDREQLSNLLRRKSFIHRHLGWHPPMYWLGYQPYLVLEQSKNILAALVCPPDEDRNTWLRLFAVAPGFSIQRAWTKLWTPALQWLQQNTAVQLINSLVIQDPMIGLLSKSGFREIYQVVVLVWDLAHARWPAQRGNVEIRDMIKDDFPRVYEIDQGAFEPIWRISLGHIEFAFKEAFSASVAILRDRIVGYQISTINPQGGHLARLAVDPGFQNQGVGSAILEDAMDRFQRQGIVQVSVNTQTRNQISVELYHKFGFMLLDEVYPVYQYTLERDSS